MAIAVDVGEWGGGHGHRAPGAAREVGQWLWLSSLWVQMLGGGHGPVK
jgi:hypothetical protein